MVTRSGHRALVARCETAKEMADTGPNSSLPNKCNALKGKTQKIQMEEPPV